MRAGALAASLLLLLGAVRGVSAEPPAGGVGAWPLRLRDAESVAGLRTTRVAGPLFRGFDHHDGSTGWSLAPLLSVLETASETHVEFLYPLGAYRARPQRFGLRLTPLFEVSPEQWSFLLAFGGRSDAGESYFGLFPLGGFARERFGRERLSFWLFPLFSRGRDRHGFTRTHLLWPLISWGSGGGRRFLRVWPLYGHDLRDTGDERRFALWPFLHWRRVSRSSGEERIRLFLPFYGERTAPHRRSRFLLGPLYVSSENTRSGERSRSVLWPLTRKAERPATRDQAGYRELRLQPFFTRKVGPDATHSGVLLGAWHHTLRADEERALERWRWLWVSRFEREQRANGDVRTRRELWPLFRFEDGRDPSHPAQGSTGRLRVPWLLPVRGEGWERSWLAPLTLYEGDWAGGESRADALWGAWQRRRSATGGVDSLAGLIRMRRSPEGARQLELLRLPLWRSEPR